MKHSTFLIAALLSAPAYADFGSLALDWKENNQPAPASNPDPVTTPEPVNNKAVSNSNASIDLSTSGPLAASTKSCEYGDWGCSVDGQHILQCNFIYDNGAYITAFAQIQTCATGQTCTLDDTNSVAVCQSSSPGSEPVNAPLVQSFKAAKAIVPEASNSTIQATIKDQYQDAITKLTAYSAVFGAILIATGLALVFLGNKLFRPVMFLGGFYFFAVLAFVIMQNVEYNSNSTIGGDHRDLVYFLVCLLVGALGGGLMLLVWKLGFFAVGAALGYVLAILLTHSASSRDYKHDRALSCDWRMPIMIASTALGGSYATFVGLDVFAQTGFVDIARAIVSGRGGSLGSVDISTKWIYMLSGCVLLAIVGISVQIYFVKRNGNKHQGLLQRNVSQAQVGHSKTAVASPNYSRVPEGV
ncbi:hypothetical protein BDR26DRAFT_897281 [Obelidium mucronatum]|nr:hypothetical protein BDR26DRAFT_897281 [Obelidium mucronatum]